MFFIKKVQIFMANFLLWIYLSVFTLFRPYLLSIQTCVESWTNDQMDRYYLSIFVLEYVRVCISLFLSCVYLLYFGFRLSRHPEGGLFRFECIFNHTIKFCTVWNQDKIYSAPEKLYCILTVWKIGYYWVDKVTIILQIDRLSIDLPVGNSPLSRPTRSKRKPLLQLTLLIIGRNLIKLSDTNSIAEKLSFKIEQLPISYFSWARLSWPS